MYVRYHVLLWVQSNRVHRLFFETRNEYKHKQSLLRISHISRTHPATIHVVGEVMFDLYHSITACYLLIDRRLKETGLRE
jgi:hypothetical protein